MISLYSLNPALRAEAHKIARLEFAARDNPSRADEFSREARLLSVNLARKHWKEVKDVAFTSLVDGRPYEVIIRVDGSYSFEKVPF